MNNRPLAASLSDVPGYLPRSDGVAGCLVVLCYGRCGSHDVHTSVIQLKPPVQLYAGAAGSTHQHWSAMAPPHLSQQADNAWYGCKAGPKASSSGVIERLIAFAKQNPCRGC